MDDFNSNAHPQLRTTAVKEQEPLTLKWQELEPLYTADDGNAK